MSTKFGIEWAYGEFRVGRFQQGECVESWRSPEPVTDLESLNWAMYQARQHVDMSRGGSVAIAYEDDSHAHKFLEVPVVSKKDLEKYLARRVDQDKFFEGDAAWCYHDAKRGAGKDGVLLHLMPRHIVDAVIRICEENYLVPKRLVPLTEVLSEHVPTLGAKSDEVLLLIAPFKSRVELVVSLGNGDILFVRELAYGWKDHVDRLVMDVNRTSGYCKQRITGQLCGIWVIGEHPPSLIAELSGQLEAEVRSDESSQSPTFWMSEVATLPQNLSSNFIPKLARQAINRKSLTRAAVLAGVALMACSVAVVGGVEFVISQHSIDSDRVEQDIEMYHDEVHSLEQKIIRVKDFHQTLDHLTADAFNLPALFLSHLGDLIPDGLVLSQARMTRNGASWEVNLSGTSALPLDELAAVLSHMQQTISGEPWNTQITQSWEDSWMRQLESGGATSQDVVGFEIVGLLQ